MNSPTLPRHSTNRLREMGTQGEGSKIPKILRTSFMHDPCCSSHIFAQPCTRVQKIFLSEPQRSNEFNNVCCY